MYSIKLCKSPQVLTCSLVGPNTFMIDFGPFTTSLRKKSIHSLKIVDHFKQSPSKEVLWEEWIAVKGGWRLFKLLINLSSGKFNILSGKCQRISKLVFCGNHGYQSCQLFVYDALLALRALLEIYPQKDIICKSRKEGKEWRFRDLLVKT